MSAAEISEFPILPTSKQVERNLIDLLQEVERDEKGAQMQLREGSAKLYRYAFDIRNDADLFQHFLAASPVAALKRPPKSSSQVLRAVLNLAYPAKLASARFRRLKASWDAQARPEQVHDDLIANGCSSNLVKLQIAPEALRALHLASYPTGTVVGITLIATVQSYERLLCEISAVVEY